METDLKNTFTGRTTAAFASHRTRRREPSSGCRSPRSSATCATRAGVTEEEVVAARDVLATRTFRRGAARDAPVRTMVLTDLEWRTAPQPLLDLVLLPHDPNW